jgi:hypothetical protein
MIGKESNGRHERKGRNGMAVVKDGQTRKGRKGVEEEEGLASSAYCAQ